MFSSSNVPGHIIKMSSMNLSHLSGGVPSQDAKALSSSEAMKRLARWGAHLVPMATLGAHGHTTLLGVELVVKGEVVVPKDNLE